MGQQLETVTEYNLLFMQHMPWRPDSLVLGAHWGQAPHNAGCWAHSRDTVSVAPAHSRLSLAGVGETLD